MIAHFALENRYNQIKLGSKARSSHKEERFAILNQNAIFDALLKSAVILSPMICDIVYERVKYFFRIKQKL